jgi:cytochrome bd-type quinol oxidase subunit 2
MIAFLSATPTLAENSAIAEIQKGLTATNKEAGYSSLKLPDLIGNFISVILGVVGIIFLVLAVYAGVMYMTAGGDPGKVKKAKEILTQSLIGLIIIVAAYALTQFVVDQIIGATSSASAG